MVGILLVFSLIRLAIAVPVEPDKTPTVFVKSVKRTELFDQLSYPARLVSKINAGVLSETDGVVAKIIAPLGQTVSKDSPLMIVRHTDPIFQFKPVTIVSPVNGAVSQVDVTEGSLVSRGMKLASVTDPFDVRVVIEIAATDLKSIVPRLRGELKIGGYDKSVPIRVLGVSPFVDPATGTATCEVELLQNQKNKLMFQPGLTGQVSFKVNLHQGLSVPEHAIHYREQETYVKLVADGKAKKTPVVLGRKQRGEVEIVQGLKEGDALIDRASGFVADGEAVRMENQK